MFQVQRRHRGASAISRVTAGEFLRQRCLVSLRLRSLFFIRELLRVFVHQVHGSQGLELRVSDATDAVEPYGVYVSCQHMRASDSSLAREAVSADSGSS